ncbi:MAG: CZB domain-containing protein [Spirochaetales bacterium]|nr:CZB domain-containing protein [Spirochaetales bacterium]
MKLSTKLLSGFVSLIVLVIIISSLSIVRFIQLGRLSASAVKEGNSKSFAFQKEIDHLTWINDVSDLFLLDHVHTLDVETDPTRCGLGEWIYGQEMQDEARRDPELKALLDALKVPHKALHESAVRIGSLYREFDIGALAAVNEAWLAHLDWLQELSLSIMQNRRFTGQTNPRLCDFGAWYYSYTAKDSRLGELLAAWEDPHERLHASARRIDELLGRADRDGAADHYRRVTLPALEDIRAAHEGVVAYTSGIQNQQDAARDIFTNDTMQALSETQEHLADLVAFFEQRAADAQASMEQMTTQVIYLVSIVSLIIVAAGLILAIIITRSVLAQLGEDPSVLSKITHQIAQGDMRINLDRKHNQAVGVYLSMLKMVDSLVEKSRIIESFAEGDLRMAVSRVSDVDKLGESLQLMKDSFNEILGHVHVAVDQVAIGADQVSQASQNLSQGATEQASSLEEISATMTEVNSQSQANAVNATEANSLARQAAVDAKSGNEHMSELINAMKRITGSSEEIAKVVKVIDDIAFQINLLALNANVEAARAGKYGKGFAVVAEEVRNLAARSTASVRETSDIIDSSLKTIQDGDRLVRQTADQLDAIVKGVTKVATFLEEITTASSEQAQAVSEISTGLDQIDQVTQSNTASAEESASSAEELASQAQQLRTMINRFKLDGGTARIEDRTV